MTINIFFLVDKKIFEKKTIYFKMCSPKYHHFQEITRNIRRINSSLPTKWSSHSPSIWKSLVSPPISSFPLRLYSFQIPAIQPLLSESLFPFNLLLMVPLFLFHSCSMISLPLFHRCSMLSLSFCAAAAEEDLCCFFPASSKELTLEFCTHSWHL